MQAQFWAGPANYPSANLGRYVANSSGIIQFSFAASFWGGSVGSYVLVADVNPSPCSEGYWVAAPRPYARFSVTA